MASLKETKRRILSVKNTQKITKAMKLVSSAKYARAQQRRTSADLYYQEFRNLVSGLSSQEGKQALWFGEPEVEEKSLIILLTSDRGLCGGYNAMLFKELDFFMQENRGTSFDFYHVLVLSQKVSPGIVQDQNDNEQFAQRHGKKSVQ